VNGEKNRFLEKVVTIRKRLVEALDPGLVLTAPMPVRFLLALEREVHMFLALAGGETAASILQSALNVYGNPESQVFQSDEAKANLPTLLQHLAALIRGIARTGSESDVILLDQVKKREKAFSQMSGDPRHAAMVRRVFGWIDPAKREIDSRLRLRKPAAAAAKEQAVSR
jgi:hypothetical protein